MRSSLRMIGHVLVLLFVTGSPRAGRAAADAAAARAELERRGVSFTPQDFTVACRRSPELVRLFLDAGMDANEGVPWLLRTPLDVDRPLTEAARHGRVEIIRMLLGAGADPNVVDPATLPAIGVRPPKDASRADLPALHAAAAAGQAEAVTALVAGGAKADLRDREGRTALHAAAAAQGTSTAAVGALLKAGADPNAEGAGRVTPLMTAAASGSAEVLRLLIEGGARVDASDDHGRTALHHAARGGSAGLVRALLAAGADSAARDATGSTPLHVAARSARGMAPLRELLAAGADVAARDGKGTTAVMGARKGAVRLLAEAGADLDAEDPEGWTALMLAERDGRTGVAAALRAGGASLAATQTLRAWWRGLGEPDRKGILLLPLPIAMLVAGALLLRRM